MTRLFIGIKSFSVYGCITANTQAGTSQPDSEAFDCRESKYTPPPPSIARTDVAPIGIHLGKIDFATFKQQLAFKLVAIGTAPNNRNHAPPKCNKLQTFKYIICYAMSLYHWKFLEKSGGRGAEFVQYWGVQSSISLSIESAPPLSNSLHTNCLFS